MQIHPIQLRPGFLCLPYAPEKRKDSTNWGFRNLRRQPEAISEIPELSGWPELEELMRVVNAPSGIFLSVGCEKNFRTIEHQDPSCRTALTSYVGIAFEILEWNADSNNYQGLAAEFGKFCADVVTDEHIQVWFEVQQTNFGEQHFLGWSMAYCSSGFGQTEAAARSAWGVSIRKFQEFVVYMSQKNADILKGDWKTVSGPAK